MGYSSKRGRKPIERASKITHAEIIANPEVKAFLDTCAVRKKPDQKEVGQLATVLTKPEKRHIDAIIAIDGGFTETTVQSEYPSAAICFFTFGPLFFKLEDLAKLDAQTFIQPEDMAALKNIQRCPPLVIPTKNVQVTGTGSLSQSIRQTIHKYFIRPQGDNEPALVDAFRWLIFCMWEPGSPTDWTIPNCPNKPCSATDIGLTSKSPNEFPCPKCSKPIYITDALRLDERIDEEQGAGGIISYLLGSLEQLVLVQLIKTIYEMKKDLLRQVLFIKDGPLAFFGQTAPLTKPMRKLVAFLLDQTPLIKVREKGSLLNLVGLEKSGTFVEHAVQIEAALPANSVLIPTNDYIYKYVIPGDPAGNRYGYNTYYGTKCIFRSHDGNTYVPTIPPDSHDSDRTAADIPNLNEILSIVSALKCNMYENALIPVALANKLVSLSDFPSSRILQLFAKRSLA